MNFVCRNVCKLLKKRPNHFRVASPLLLSKKNTNIFSANQDWLNGRSYHIATNSILCRSTLEQLYRIVDIFRWSLCIIILNALGNVVIIERYLIKLRKQISSQNFHWLSLQRLLWNDFLFKKKSIQIYFISFPSISFPQWIERRKLQGSFISVLKVVEKTKLKTSPADTLFQNKRRELCLPCPNTQGIRKNMFSTAFLAKNCVLCIYMWPHFTQPKYESTELKMSPQVGE